MNFEQITNASQAAEFQKEQQEKMMIEQSNYINIQQLAEMMYENQKSSKRQFIITVIISLLTLSFAVISCYLGYIQLLK